MKIAKEIAKPAVLAMHANSAKYIPKKTQKSLHFKKRLLIHIYFQVLRNT